MSKAYLLRSSSGATSRYSLRRGQLSIGAEPDNDLVMSQATVSRHHARIRYEKGRYELVDLNSTNGTMLNGRLLKRPAQLKDRDQLNIGGVEFIFQYHALNLARLAQSVAIVVIAGGVGFAAYLIAGRRINHAAGSVLVSPSPEALNAPPSPIAPAHPPDVSVGEASSSDQPAADLQRRADSGDASAEKSVGDFYKHKSEPSQALLWYQKSADQGYAAAEVEVGYAYDDGKGVAEDKDTALKWFKKAAAQGNGEAQHALGYAYQYGDGVKQDYVEAAKWYQLAVAQGVGAWTYGEMVGQGEGVPQDKIKAAELFEYAAVHPPDTTTAIYDPWLLSTMYDSGDEVPRDRQKAANWFAFAMATSAAAPFAAGRNNRMVPIANKGREFTVYIPAKFDPHTAVPLVIMLHGQGMKNDDLIAATGWDRLAERYGFIAAFPQGYRGNWDDGHFSRSDADVQFIGAIIDTIGKHAQLDPRRIFVTGYSMGASMAYRVGAELSDRIAAIAPDSGQLWMPPVRLNSPVSLMYMVGTADQVNPIGGGNGRPPAKKTISSWRTMLKCPDDSRPINAGTSVKAEIWGPCEGDSAVALYQIDKLAHYWPAPQDGFDATPAVWQFFSQHPKAR